MHVNFGTDITFRCSVIPMFNTFTFLLESTYKTFEYFLLFTRVEILRNTFT